MRLDDPHIRPLNRLVHEEAGAEARLRLFGSRLDDQARCGDVDLLVEISGPIADPACLAARLAARAGRLLDGRSVDVVLSAPNLKRLPIHDTAFRTGVEI